jgi:beta-glucosidase
LQTIASGAPVIGHSHGSLLEQIFGYRMRFGLHSVDPTAVARIPKPIASVYGAIARADAI